MGISENEWNFIWGFGVGVGVVFPVGFYQGRDLHSDT